MKVGPSAPAIRSWCQTTVGCCRKERGWGASRKRRDMIPSGVVQRDERKRTADERSKQNGRCQNRGRESLREESGGRPAALPRRHAAEKRRASESGSCMERENLSSRC